MSNASYGSDQLGSRVAARYHLEINPRHPQDEKESTESSPSEWFYIVDPDPPSTEGLHTLGNHGVLLCSSSRETDAKIVANLDDLRVVWHSQLSEEERRRVSNVFEPSANVFN